LISNSFKDDLLVLILSWNWPCNAIRQFFQD
jgi:hypothetical protein